MGIHLAGEQRNQVEGDQEDQQGGQETEHVVSEHAFGMGYGGERPEAGVLPLPAEVPNLSPLPRAQILARRHHVKQSEQTIRCLDGKKRLTAFSRAI